MDFFRFISCLRWTLNTLFFIFSCFHVMCSDCRASSHGECRDLVPLPCIPSMPTPATSKHSLVVSSILLFAGNVDCYLICTLCSQKKYCSSPFLIDNSVSSQWIFKIFSLTYSGKFAIKFSRESQIFQRVFQWKNCENLLRIDTAIDRTWCRTFLGCSIFCVPPLFTAYTMFFI